MRKRIDIMGNANISAGHMPSNVGTLHDVRLRVAWASQSHHYRISIFKVNGYQL